MRTSLTISARTRRLLDSTLSLLACSWLTPGLIAEQPIAAPIGIPLQAARVLSGEGYERRATLSELSLAAGTSIDLPIFLLQQNTYCFLLASANSADELSFAVCDRQGSVVKSGSYLQVKEPLHIFHLRPESSGRHLLRIVNLGDTEAQLALGYCYR